jgi:S-adenosylmethionine hydrolase
LRTQAVLTYLLAVLKILRVSFTEISPARGGALREQARTFSDRPPGTAFWYENSDGLVEIAVNQGVRIASRVSQLAI